VGRLASRLAVLPAAALERLQRPRREPPGRLGRVLIAHHLLLGDTLMLTPLLAKLRSSHPAASVTMTVPRAIAPLYAGRPYGVEAIPYDPRDRSTLAPLLGGDGFDLAIVPGDNRFSWLALAAGARWIRAFAGDTPAYKNWPVDEAIAYPGKPAAWGDMVARLVPGPDPVGYSRSDWPAPDCAPYDKPPADRYAVLHVGASSPLKRWAPARWRALAESLESAGLVPVFSAGRGEEAEVAAIDPGRRWQSHAGRLDLAQMWHLLERASLLVAPDTGVAHLGRLVNVPTVALFGPGSALVSGAGEFWRQSPFRAVTIPDFPCRDQTRLFRREIPWVRRCGRGTHECASARCMAAIDVSLVRTAVADLIEGADA